MADQKQQDIKVKVVETKPCSIKLNVEVPHCDVKTETDKAYQEIQQSAKIPGFRPGKAPMDAVKNSYSETAKDKVIEKLLKKHVFKALEDQKFSAIDIPVVNEINFDFEKPFIFTFTAEKHPEFKVKDYKGVKIKKQVNKIDEEFVNKTLESLRERNARLSEAGSDTALSNSFVSVDYDCYLGSELLKDLSSKNQLIDLSSPQTVPGFKEGLTGVKKGEEKSIKINFPADYMNKTLAGKEAEFKIKILEIKEKILPKLDDEFAKDLGAENLQDLKKKVKESLEYEESKKQSEDVEKQLFEQLIKSNDFPVPSSIVEEQKKALMERMSKYLKSQGYDQKMIDKSIENSKEKYQKDAVDTVKLSYILGAIAREENIAANDQELNAEHDRVIKSNPGKEKEVEKYFSENKDRIMANIKEEKIFKFLMDNAKISEIAKK